MPSNQLNTQQHSDASSAQQSSVVGMLYLVEVRLIRSATSEKIKHRLLIVGCEQQDIERKLRWLFDAQEFSSFSIGAVEKIREKVHILSTVVTAETPAAGPIVEVGERTTTVHQGLVSRESYDPKLYAVGVTTTMMAKDEAHALRKVGSALIASATEGRSHSAPSLSAESQVQVEHIPRSSGHAKPRDVSAESNRAHIFRG
jgi:hypothetical protein